MNEMKNEVTVTWGNNIYDDDTIVKYTVYTFDTRKGFLKAWSVRSGLTSGEYTATIKDLTIKYREFVPLSEYIKAMEEEE